MTTSLLFKQAIETRFSVQKAASAYAAYPVQWPKRDFTIPNNVPWFAFDWMETVGKNINIGRVKWVRWLGHVQVDCLVPSTTKDEVLLTTMSEWATHVFMNWETTVAGTGVARFSGPVENRSVPSSIITYNRKLVRVSYERDERIVYPA